MYGHERALVKELKDKPFALVGYNVGDELEHIQAVSKEKALIWRSFFGGEDPTVPEKYNVRGYPTVIIIDAEGVIRSIGHEENDALIHELLSAM